ncbi:MAG TPA: PP2C family protein-serine/threonine phosphatase [Actinocrinis sp.]|jgi:serine phosphatase RsbU (regulator of sigma subunit)
MRFSQRPAWQQVLLVLPFAVMVPIAVADLATGSRIGLLALYSLGPAFASVAGSARRALVVGGLALVLCVLSSLYDNMEGSARQAAALSAIVGTTGAALLAGAVRRRVEHELSDVRLIAQTAQRVLLRPVPTLAGPMRIAVSYSSAASAARIGGDLYEVASAPHSTRVIIGDVQGKGLEAVETAALVVGAFREAAPEEDKLAEVGQRLERALNRRLEGEKFVTAVLAEVDDEHCVTLVNYGHPAPLLLGADGSITFAEPLQTAPPLGLATLGPDGPVPYSIFLHPGDQMLLYTDGVTEARNRDGDFYPLADRVGLLRDPDPEKALEAMRRDLEAYVRGPLTDDAAMLLLRYRDPDDRQS